MSRRAVGEPWFVGLENARPTAVLLFCFPYAGGNAATYRDWTSARMRGIHAAAAHLPGRADRILEAPIRDTGPLVRALLEAVRPFTNRRYAFFGHSMGALIAFELARALRGKGLRGPERLLVSARRAPHLRNRTPAIHDLPQLEFLRELRNLEGTPESFFGDPELLDLMLPVLRADFELCHCYRFEPGEPLDCPITAYGGTEDSAVSQQDLEAWRRHTQAEFRLHMLPGGHFFPDTVGARFAGYVAEECSGNREASDSGISLQQLCEQLGRVIPGSASDS